MQKSQFCGILWNKSSRVCRYPLRIGDIVLVVFFTFYSFAKFARLMDRIIGIDFGSARTELAVSDQVESILTADFGGIRS